MDCYFGVLPIESSHVMLSPWLKLSSRVSGNGDYNSPFEAAHGKDVWAYASSNPGHNSLINGAMASHARIAMSAIVDRCPEAFEGVGCLVDVGGGDGTALRTLMKSCPSISHGINFDLPHVVSVAPEFDGVENVGGDMFEVVPKADAAFLMVYMFSFLFFFWSLLHLISILYDIEMLKELLIYLYMWYL
ncbi:PREDICTED: caffeic acid 3-O-methyltransferase 3-like [Erythranthe guttata]|uniref:caffeic acid 3-O-methyltransferase 3-like n=1 Tax=Erythranthe guttata TaxID=4155 RepID=UPI00064DD474|nr:PREDICTED: caffeic acid 3-O-methyltransferase 3-like [Erythranthe guttata]|eukprot:XP_012833655.1 PREDICTED: caffeic acid 3-O-methyltransferase 3-like [Erythranthe guttata]